MQERWQWTDRTPRPVDRRVQLTGRRTGGQHWRGIQLHREVQIIVVSYTVINHTTLKATGGGGGGGRGSEQCYNMVLGWEGGNHLFQPPRKISAPISKEDIQ